MNPVLLSPNSKFGDATRTMKPMLLLLLICAVSIASGAELDGIAARVNGDSILYSQLLAGTAPEERLLREAHKGKDLLDAVIKLRASHLNQMIDRLLLLQELNRLSFPLPAHATDEQIDAAIRDRFSSDRQQWLKRLKTKATIERY